MCTNLSVILLHPVYMRMQGGIAMKTQCSLGKEEAHIYVHH